MTTLAIHSLDETVTQRIHITKPKIILGFKVNLIKVGLLTDGNLILRLKHSGGTFGTVTIPYTELNLLGTNWHGQKAFQFDAPININLLYDIDTFYLDVEISTTCTQTKYIYLGLIHEPHPVNINHLTDQPYYPTYGNDPTIDVWNNPYTIDMITLK